MKKQIPLKSLKEENARNYLRKYSTSKNKARFEVMTKARFLLISGELSQESFDIFMEHMNS